MSAADISGEDRDGSLSVALSVEVDAWRSKDLGDIETFIAETFVAAMAGAGMPDGTQTELSVTLTDDAAIRELNGSWRDKDKPTNVLSFPMQALQPGEVPGPLIGDLVLALETCQRESQEEGKAFADHVRHLLVHGILHCLGHDHLDDDSADEMERLERDILIRFGIDDPYAEDDLEACEAGSLSEPGTEHEFHPRTTDR